jgi:hypothetical protein
MEFQRAMTAGLPASSGPGQMVALARSHETHEGPGGLTGPGAV